MASIKQPDDGTLRIVDGRAQIGSGVSPDTVTFSPAAGAANVCNVTITVKDNRDPTPATLGTSRTLLVWLSDAATGIGATATTASGTVTATTGTDLVDLTAKKVKLIQTNAAGVIVLEITDIAKTAFRVCATPLGSPHGAHQVSSALITGNYG